MTGIAAGPTVALRSQRKRPMFAGSSILVVEAEFLIALDIQRILEAAHANQMIFARHAGEGHALEERWSEFHLAIIEIPPGDEAALDLFKGLGKAGVPVVVSSADGAYRRGLAQLDGAVLLMKPFGEQDLLAACRKALSRDADAK